MNELEIDNSRVGLGSEYQNANLMTSIKKYSYCIKWNKKALFLT